MKHCKPTNSYRFQLSKTFGFYDLTKILPFLNKIGIDLVYTSPYFQTPKHSNNPYEITSSEHIDHKYGASKGFEVFLKKIQSLNMGHMMDVVANHMASSPENPWFYDVLKKGRQSQYFSFFAFRFLDDQERVILPYLSKSLKESISEGSVFLEKKSSTLIVNTKRLPVKRGSEKLSLEQLVAQQHYKLIDYHNANKLVNFRRFFDIHELIGLNMHLPKVFKAYHQKIVHWFKRGYIQGFRVDHPDGLHDPSSYFHLLKKSCPNAYIVAEKILQPAERMPKDWQIDGSVGYDYLNILNQLFVDSSGSAAFDRIYKRFSFNHKNPCQLLVDLKKSYIKKYLASELAFFSQKIYEKATLRVSRSEFKEAFVCFLANIGVYRTYIKAKGSILKKDRQILEVACKDLRLVFRRFFFGPFLAKAFRSILQELQEIMPAVFAKGFEDTFLYRYIRLISLNEVGSNPVNFGMAKSEYFKLCREKIKNEPYTMTTSSTHDTKRSEDTRMRLNILSQMPESFDHWLKKVEVLHEPLRKKIGVIDKSLQYLFYQTILGIWPNKACSQKEIQKLVERIIAYCIKASREAKKYTDWVNINSVYENGVKRFITSALNGSSSKKFLLHIESLIHMIAPCGNKSSISSLLIRLTTCGVFDLYQGQECFKFDLVDPDNRRSVNFKKSENLLEQVCAEMRATKSPSAILKRWYCHLENNKFRIWMLKTLLNFRQKHHSLFIHGTLRELKVIGLENKSLMAFARILKKEVLIVIAPLFLHRLKNKKLHVQIPFDFRGVELLSGEKAVYKMGEHLPFEYGSQLKVLYMKKK